MDKDSVVGEVYKEFKERMSSPLIFSFLISWCVINWKIIIGLIFYDMTDLHRDHYCSYIHLIANNLKPSSAFVRRSSESNLLTVKLLAKNGFAKWDALKEHYQVEGHYENSNCMHSKHIV
jgi:hypothetical protein